MPSLDVTFADGRRETRALSRSSPVNIGAQSFNDLCVPGSDVGPLHCRIGWNKTGFEVTAATSKGVDLNGTIVEHAFLKPGDVLRIGSADIEYVPDQPAAKPTPAAPEPPAAKAVKEPEKGAKIKPSKPVAQPVAADDELSLFEGPVVAEPVADEFEASDDELPADTGGKPKPPPEGGVVASVGREIQGSRQRPGEQEIFKSPIILGLGVGGILLLLISGTLYFLMGRESALRLYDLAHSDLNEGRYAQAIENYERFVAQYPRHFNAEAARIGIGKARIQRELSGGAPNWPGAWDQLNEFVREFRNTAAYRELRPLVLDYAEQLALGAAKAAEAARDRTLLPVSQEATTLLERTIEPDTPVEPILERIRSATDKAQAAIVRQEARDASVKVMQDAIANGRMIDALAERDRLLRSYPQFVGDQGVQAVLNEALSRAKSTVTPLEPAATPPAAAETSSGLSVLPVFHQRSRTDEASLGQTVWVLAQDSCYAVDSITGEVVWRRVIGDEPAFAPVVTRGAQPGWLLFDRRRRELLHCRADNGQPWWRTGLLAEPRGAPLVDQGQLYLATTDRRLLRIDLETGEINAALQFAQDIAGPPALNAERDHMFLAGSRGLIYAVSLRPLVCVAVTFTDHPEGSVVAPLSTLGHLLLACQNDQPDRSTLRVYDAREPARPLPPVDTQAIAGGVYDPPVLRGPQLVVPSQGERLSAFVVNDEPGRMGLTKVGDYRVQNGYGGPMQVMLGPDEQFWMSSTAFRRFAIGTDSLRIDSPAPAAVGLTSQPLQAIAETFFVARRWPGGEAVQFTNIDRDRMTGSWRIAVGARPTVMLGGNNGPAVLLTESGFVFAIGTGRLSSGGTELRGGTSLELSPTLSEPLQIGSLGDGRGVIAAGGDTPLLWIVEANGRLGQPLKLSKPVERPPVLLDAGLVLPLPGRLQVRPLSGNAKFEDWRAPVAGGEAPPWAYVVRTEPDELLAVDVQGHWRRLQLRGGDVPHLAEVASSDYPALSGLPPVHSGEFILFADIQKALRKLAVRTLDETTKREFTSPPLGLAMATESTACVWDREQLRLVDLGSLADRWTLPLNGLSPVGRPLVQGTRAWLGCRDGTVLVLNLETGQVASRVSVPQTLSLGVVSLQNQPWAVACDGTLYRLSEPAENRP